MFPLDQATLLILKLFVFVTCICFWVKLIVEMLLQYRRAIRKDSQPAG